LLGTAADTHTALPDAVGSTWIGKWLGFGARPSAQGLVPIVTAGCLDSIDPREVERAFRDNELAHRRDSSSSFVKNFGWPFRINGINQSRHRRRSAAAFSESSWLRLFVIEHAQPQARTDNPD
jgi:hypothetical protein